jgi:hypothetical protein
MHILSTVIFPFAWWYLMKWWWISMWFVLKSWTRLVVILMALSFSHSNDTCVNLIQLSSDVAFIHSSYAQQFSTSIYNASVVDSTTEFGFLDDHDTNYFPSIWHVFDVIFLSTLYPTQLEFKYPTNSNCDPSRYQSPSFGVCFNYLNNLFVSFK